MMNGLVSTRSCLPRRLHSFCQTLSPAKWKPYMPHHAPFNDAEISSVLEQVVAMAHRPPEPGSQICWDSDSTIAIQPHLPLSKWLKYVHDQRQPASGNHEIAQRKDAATAAATATFRNRTVAEISKLIDASNGENFPDTLLSKSLSVPEIVAILKSLTNKDVAFRFYEWVKKQPNYLPSLPIFQTVFNSLVSADDWEKLPLLIEEITEKKMHMVSEPLLRILLMSSQHKAKSPNYPFKVRVCERWFDKLKELGVRPERLTYHLMMEMYNTAKLFERTLSLFEEMQKFHPLNCGAYGRAITACKGLRSLTMAEKLWAEMLGFGIRPGLQCCTIFLATLGQLGNTEKAFGFFQEMQSVGIIADLQIFTTMINFLAKAQRVDEAAKLFQELLVSGSRIDAFVVVVMMLMYKQAKLWNEVISTFQILHQKHLEMTTACYNLAVEAYAEINAWEAAIELFKEARQKQLSLEPHVYVIMMHIYFMVGRYNDCELLFDILMQKRLIHFPRAYKIMMSVYAQTQRLPDALNVFNAMMKNLSLPKHYLYNMSIPLITEFDLPLALALYQEIQKTDKNLSSNVYRILIKAQVQKRDLVLAKALYDDMIKVKLQPDRQVFLYMLSGYRDIGEAENANQIYEDSKTYGCYPDAEIFETMVDIYSKAGKHLSLEAVLLEMKTSGLKPD